MKAVLLMAVIAASSSVMAQSDHQRSGYVTRNGTYVAPSYATNPNESKLDNYSTRGNYNPYTGKAGTVDPYKIEPIKPVAPSYYGVEPKRSRGY